MAQRPTLLRTLITRRHWQVFETFKLHFERTANELAEQDRDPTLVGLTVSKRQFERWYGGEVKTRPYPALCRVLEAMFRYPVDVLLGPADEDGAAVDAVPQLRLVMPTRPPSPSLEPREGDSGFDGIEFTSRPVPGDNAYRDTLERQVAMAARRAFRFSAMAEGSNVGPETLDELHQEVRRLAAAYPQLPLAPSSATSSKSKTSPSDSSNTVTSAPARLASCTCSPPSPPACSPRPVTTSAIRGQP